MGTQDSRAVTVRTIQRDAEADPVAARREVDRAQAVPYMRDPVGRRRRLLMVNDHGQLGNGTMDARAEIARVQW
jgi:hypothetical protein